MRFLWLGLFIIINSGNLVRAEEWSGTERSAMTEAECLKIFPHGKFITRPLKDKETFKFFYFTTAPVKAGKANILHFAGGPGAVMGPEGTFRKDEGVDANVFYFHTRGSGCSQVPADKSYDQFLTLNKVSEDVEAMRGELKLEKWDLVYGISAGTAQGYVYAQKYPNSLNKYISEGTVSAQRDQELADTVTHKLFIESFSQNAQIQKLLTKAQIINAIPYFEFINENKIGRFVAISHSSLEDLEGIKISKEDIEILKKKMNLFIAIGAFAYSGYQSSYADTQEMLTAAANVLVHEVYPKKVTEAELAKSIKILHETRDYMVKPREIEGVKFKYVSKRILNVMSKEIAEKFDPQSIVIYTPTLILTGSHDLVTTSFEAKSVFEDALRGPKSYLEIEGAGHYDSLPLGCYAKVIAEFLRPNPNIKAVLKTDKLCAGIKNFEFLAQ